MIGRILSHIKKIIKHKEDVLNDEGNWNSYFCTRDDHDASVFLNLELIDFAPMSDKPYLHILNITMINPREDGLSSNDEFDELMELEDAIEQSIKGFSTIYAGRITTNKRRNLYFYSHYKEDFQINIEKTMALFPTYSYEMHIEEDSLWQKYEDELYPDPRQYQMIENNMVVEQLEVNGDSLEKERLVYHWIYFKDESDKKKFLEVVLDMGFEVESESHDAEEIFPYGLNISRIDRVDYNSINTYSLDLWDIAENCNAVYDGWETSVE